MKEIIYTIRVFPDENVNDLDDLLKRISESLKSGKIAASQVADYFFGMKVLLLNIEAPEVDGISDRMEEEIRDVQGVSEMEVLRVSRKVEVWK
ncbi:MAG: hypothetical protein ACUVQ0_00245 [Thermoproteota archaeon]